MLRRVILLRHAEASADAPSDRQRALTAEGETRAARIGQRIADLGWRPDRIVTSSAERARRTTTLVREAFGALGPRTIGQSGALGPRTIGQVGALGPRTIGQSGEVVTSAPLATEVVDPSLYDEGADAIRRALAAAAAAVGTSLIVAHNPAISVVASRLAMQSVALSPAEAALLSVTAATWTEALLLEGTWSLDFVVSP